MSRRPLLSGTESGFSMIEVLVTIVILAFGLLGLAGLQMRMQVAEMESYQRAQALALLSDMSGRIWANNVTAATYVSASTIGTGDSQPTSCLSIAAGSVARDLCEWSNALKGASETTSTGTKIGSVIGARGCITQVQTADTTAGVCRPAIYEVAVAWQGMAATAASAQLCGQNLYGTDSYRRVVSTRITVGLPACT